MDTELLQYERAITILNKKLPGQASKLHTNEKNNIDSFITDLETDLKQQIKTITSDFDSASSGKAAKKIDGNLSNLHQKKFDTDKKEKTS